MLTAPDLYQSQNLITDAPRHVYQQRARKDWFASDDTSSAGTVVVLVADPFMVNPVLTQPAIEFTEDLTRLNFKVVTEQVELSFVDEVVSTPSLSFARVLEVDLGE